MNFKMPLNSHSTTPFSYDASPAVEASNDDLADFELMTSPPIDDPDLCCGPELYPEPTPELRQPTFGESLSHRQDLIHGHRGHPNGS